MPKWDLFQLCKADSIFKNRMLKIKEIKCGVY